MRALLVGHFTTIGDIQVLEVVERLLCKANIGCDVAPYTHAHSADPRCYSHLIVICGPCWPGLLKKYGLDIRRYQHCKRIGINLTMLQPLAEWNPFDTLLERDSDSSVRPDLAFLADKDTLPLLGRCIVHLQQEYATRQRHERVLRLIDDLVERRKLPVIDIDTRLPGTRNSGGVELKSAVASVIAKVDVMVTNRLHGLVLALRHGVPALAIDAVAGGGKVTAQARLLQWPICLSGEHATAEEMDRSLHWCLSVEAREMAVEARQRALTLLNGLEAEFIEALHKPLARRGTQAGRASSRWQSLLQTVTRR